MACKPRISARIWRPCLSSLQLWVEGGAGYELQGNHREQTLTVEAVVLDKHHNNDQRINVQGDDALMVIRIIPPKAFCQFALRSERCLVSLQGGNAIMLGTVNDRTTITPSSAVVLTVFRRRSSGRKLRRP